MKGVMEKVTTIKPNQTIDPFALHYQFIDKVKATLGTPQDVEQDDDPYCLKVEEADQKEQDAKDMDGFDMLRMYLHFYFLLHEESKL
jgi:hypothetical protein